MSWSNEQIDAVWKKGVVIQGYDSNKFRVDSCGAWMARDQYGQQTVHGWEIDHVFPESLANLNGYAPAEINHIENLRPMNWENNRSKNDDYPNYSCAVTRNENRNVPDGTDRNVNATLNASLNIRYRKKSK